MLLTAIDFETTGLTLHPDAKVQLQPRAIELAAVTIDTKTMERKEFVSMFNPQRPIEPIITKITGLTNAELREAPSFASAADEILRLLDTDILVAHNLPFDAYLLYHELRLAGKETEIIWPKTLICTVQLFAPFWGRRMKLTDLYKYVMGRKLEQTHRALDDVDALIEIILETKLHEQLSTIEGEIGVFIPEELRPHRAGGR